MPVELSIVESVTELETTVVEVILESASEPGPAGPGVPAGGTVNQVLTKDSSTDYDTSWQDAQGGAGGAPTDVDYLVGTASGSLSAEIVVGTSPGGELGGTWASPTVDATHSGSSHASVQAAAEATAAAALAAHEADTTGIHGIADTSALETAAGAQAKVDAHVNDATDAHAGTAITNTPAGNIAATTVQAAINELDTEKAATASAVMDGDAAGGVLSGTYPNPGFASDMATQAELDAHVTDTTDAHDASAISFSPAGSIAATDVQAAIEEVASEAGGGGAPTDVDYLVGTASGSLSAEIVVGTSPGGELGGTWASPTVDATHSGSSHAAVQAAAEATAAAALSSHVTDTSDAHDASAISVLDSAGRFTGTDVEAVLAELGSWTTFTPTLEAVTTDPTLGSGASSSGSYSRVGDLVLMRLSFIFGSSGVNAGSGVYFVALPLSVHVDSLRFTGSCFAFISGVGRTGVCDLDAANDRVQFWIDSQNANVKNDNPATWAANAQLHADFSFKTG